MRYQVPFFNNQWDELLSEQLPQKYFQNIIDCLNKSLDESLQIYPPINQTFAALEGLRPAAIKVVLLGQDPYHGPGQAQGLSFSVPKDQKIPASLRNVYKELNQTIPSFKLPNHGNLEPWFHQGVLLLNSILTVEHKKAASHRKIGWELFTDAVIRILSKEYSGIVFMLWGKYAQKKESLIASNKHLVLKAAHPSPLARNAFLGCNHFRLANNFLEDKGQIPINWNLD